MNSSTIALGILFVAIFIVPFIFLAIKNKNKDDKQKENSEN